MKCNVIILACFLLSICIKSQSISGSFSLPPDKYSSEKYGKSIQNIYYQLSYVSNPKSGKKKEVICILQVGAEFSKFCELNTIRYDSLAEKFSKQENIGVKEMNQMFPVYPKWKTVVLKDLKKIL